MQYSGKNKKSWKLIKKYFKPDRELSYESSGPCPHLYLRRNLNLVLSYLFRLWKNPTLQHVKRKVHLRMYWIQFFTRYVFSWQIQGKYISSCKDSSSLCRVLFETTQEQLV